MASVAPKGILGLGAESDVSTVLRGRRLLVEQDWRCLIDAHDRQFTGRRPAGVHVELEVVPPGIGGAGGAPAMQDPTRLDGARWPTKWWGMGGTGAGRDDCPGHDGGRERTRT
jgi:hypothetical protein